METKQIPPQAIQAEEAVLGAILNEQGAIDEAYQLLNTYEYFYNDAHKIIYEAILLLYKEDKAIDILTVSNALKKAGNLKRAGGYAYVTKLSGRAATAIHIPDHCRMIKECAVKRKMISLGSNIYKQALDISTDIEELLDGVGNDLDQAAEWLHGTSMFYPFPYYLNKSLKNLEEREKMAKEGKTSGIATPIKKLDEYINGWQSGDLVIIASRPSMGKTALAIASAVKAAQYGYTPNIYSLEMKGERLTDRIICGMSGVDHNKFKSGFVSKEDWNKIEITIGKLEKLSIYIDDYPCPTMDYIKSRSRINKRKGKCDIIFIDYLQLTNIPSMFGKNREQEVSAMSRKAKIMAMELNVPVILLSQLNRACEMRGGWKRPQLSDLRESGAIEQDADTVLMLYRPEVYEIYQDEHGNSTRGRGEIIITKQRDGMIGTIYFGYNESLTRIYDFNTSYREIPIEQTPNYGLGDDKNLSA